MAFMNEIDKSRVKGLPCSGLKGSDRPATTSPRTCSDRFAYKFAFKQGINRVVSLYMMTVR